MRRWLGLLLVMTLAGAARAETVYLKDGARLIGRVTQAGAGGITVETPDGLLEDKKERIDRIDYAEAPQAAPAAPQPPRTATTDGGGEWRRRPNSVIVGLGGTIPLEAHGLDEQAANGGAFSLEYYRRVKERWSFGVGLVGLGFSDRNVDGPVFRNEYETGGGEFLFLGRAQPWPEQRFSPYGTLGLGTSGFHQKIHTAPTAGHTWADSGTAESRQTLDEDSNGFALRLGFGIQTDFSQRTFGAVESNWHWLTTDPHKFGYSSVQLFDLGGRVGFRF